MPKSTSHSNTTRVLLETLRDQGMTLEQCAGRKVMDRKLSTLKRWCRRFQITFPDYTPRKPKAPPQ